MKHKLSTPILAYPGASPCRATGLSAPIPPKTRVLVRDFRCNPWPAKPAGPGLPLGLPGLLGLILLLAGCTFPDFDTGSGSSSPQTPVAIFFGISDYPPLGPQLASSPIRDLDATVNDATALQETFAGLGWDTRLYTDSACNRASLAQAVQDIAAASQAGRRVLFYYSGHGSSSGSKDSASMIWWNTAGTGIEAIRAADLAGLLQPLFDCQARTCLILDSCYSGGFILDANLVDILPWNHSDSPYWQAGSWLPADLRAFLEWFGDSSSAVSDSGQAAGFDPALVWAVSAAGWNETSWESGSYADASGRSHGIFTWALLQGCSAGSDGFLAADRNRDGFTALRELYARARELMEQTWNQELAGYGAWDDYLYLPHISGNYTDIMLFTR